MVNILAVLRAPSALMCPKFLRAGIVVSLLAALAACQNSPPVQEMSDARQAIAVARDAGAESHAAAELGQAIELLELAERELGAQDYVRARRNALQAKSKALEARKLSETEKQFP